MRRLHVMFVLLTLAATIVVGSSGYGQDKKDPQPGKVSLPQGWSKLGISGEQKKKIYAVIGSYQTKIAGLKEQIETLKKEEYREAYKLLNDDQKETLKKLADKGIDDKKGEAKKDDKKGDK
jgi:hypothetical protein